MLRVAFGRSAVARLAREERDGLGEMGPGRLDRGGGVAVLDRGEQHLVTIVGALELDDVGHHGQRRRERLPQDVVELGEDGVAGRLGRDPVEAGVGLDESGDVAGLAALFSTDATLYSDGGGKAAATLNPIFGAEKIARFFIGVRDKQPEGARIEPRIVNGSLGYVVTVGDTVLQASHFEFDGDRITAVHIVRNPDKLKHLMRG